jgi:hypothetical protein
MDMSVADSAAFFANGHGVKVAHVDWINVRKLDQSFVRFLLKSVQDTFRSLVDCASAED